jgi:hypothetical protein
MNADGNGKRRLTQHGSHPAWSPDERIIAFNGGGLHVVSADGSGERRLIGSDGPFPFAWSPALPKRS